MQVVKINIFYINISLLCTVGSKLLELEQEIGRPWAVQSSIKNLRQSSSKLAD